MGSAGVRQHPPWLVENGLKELESLFRTVLYHPSQPILVLDSERTCLDANSGAGRLLGLLRDQMIGRKIDDFADPSFRPQIERLWQSFLDRGELEGTLPLLVPDGDIRDIDYAAKSNILPSRHLLVLHDQNGKKTDDDSIASWMKDYAFFLLDPDRQIVGCYSGAERLYGYKENEMIGQNVSYLYPVEDNLPLTLLRELRKAANDSHFGTENWQSRKDGSRFWGNVHTVALTNHNGELQGFARVVRDFSEQHRSAELLRRTNLRLKLPIPEPTIAGIVSGEFDRVTDASEAFLRMLGYHRDDLVGGRLHWSDLTPAEYLPLDELAHEECLRYGACTPFEKEYIRKDGTRVRVLITNAVLSVSPFRWTTFIQNLTDHEQAETVEGELGGEPHFEEIVGKSAALKRVLGQAEIVAPTDATVLLLGETGTGKEMVARSIHRLSDRTTRPFITLNCAAIPTGLLESELFGYERGAFTGALAQKIGRFELAHQGTLFLDEVGDIPLELQPKLLRALQEKEFERLGGVRTIPIDVRLIAATNRNLNQMIGDKLFRSDLYYRLKVFPITIPPLRDRPEDIPILARYFAQKYGTKMNRQIETIPSETIRVLVSWSWPGNVRELENFMERSVILSRGPKLRAPLAEIRADMVEAPNGVTLEQVEREHIIRILRQNGGVVSATATRLGLPRTTLNAMMRKLGISRKDL
jgi:PAS domain S-box-containing protein